MTGPLAIAAALAALGAPDGPERLAVLPVLLGAESQASVRQVFDAVDEASRLRPGLRVMSVDDYYFHEGQALAKRALGCGSDTACMAKQLAPFNARLGLVALVNGELDPPLVSLILLDGAGGDVAAQWAGQVSGGPDGVRAQLREQTAALLETRGFTQHGRLRVQVRPDRASVRVGEDTTPDLGTPGTFTLPPGPHTVHAFAEGHASGTAEVTVTAGGLVELELELEPQASLLSSPWLWVGVGVVVAGAAAAATAVAVGGGDGACLCVQTKDMMDCGGCP